MYNFQVCIAIHKFKKYGEMFDIKYKVTILVILWRGLSWHACVMYLRNCKSLCVLLLLRKYHNVVFSGTYM